MAAEVAPLPQLKLPEGPTPFTAEQRYWKSFKNPKFHTSTASWPVTHISFPSSSSSTSLSSSSTLAGAPSAGLSTSTTTAARANDLFAVTAGPRVDVYSIRKREPLKTIGRFDSVARSAEIRADSRVLLAGDDSGKMQVFDLAGGSRAAILKTWTVHRQPVWVTRWSPAELTTLMSASDDKTVRLWDLPSASPTRTFVGHQDYVRCGAFMPGAAVASGNMVVSGSYDATVRLWDARVPGAAVLTFKHAAPVEAVLPLLSGTAVLAAADNTVSVLDLVAAKPLRLITNHQKTVTSLCLASHGRRVVTGALDGHVKVFETGSWNVVAGAKYPSPILAVSVVAAGANGDDRHLAVGMQSGVLSIRTRMSGAAAARDAERRTEMAALEAGTLGAHDAARAKRRRRTEASRRLDMVGEDVDVVIAADGRRGKRETRWQRDLRQGRFAAALDAALDPATQEHSHLTVLTVLVALRHRCALRDALEGRSEASVQPVLRWVCAHIVDPRYVGVCCEVGAHLLDLYAQYAGESAALAGWFRRLRGAVRREVERAQVACQLGGMVDSLMLGAV